MINGWDFYDTEKFTKENIDTIIAARDTEYQRKSIGECLGIFLEKCIGGFCLDRPFAGFALMLLLWLACSRRRAEGLDNAPLYSRSVLHRVHGLYLYRPLPCKPYRYRHFPVNGTRHHHAYG